MSVTIWHNPRCSKSRTTLSILEEQGISPEIVLYNETPPTREQIEAVLNLLGLEPLALMRKGEAVFKEKNLSDPALSRDDLISAMVENPILIERPVVLANGKAALGRPPEEVLKIL